MKTRTYRRPPKLRQGGCIGVMAPSSPVRNTRVEAGLQYLRKRGFRLVLGEHLYDSYGYLAGLDDARTSDLNVLLARDDVDAVIFARGGYGACRIVDRVDWKQLQRNPKVLVGYSDLTTLHLAAAKHANVVTFHGPMVVTLGEGLSDSAEALFWRALTDPTPLGQVASRSADIECVRPGTARGVLAGGCLSLICASLGCSEAPDFAGCIVVLEDTDEPLYRVDRMLVQLVRSGCLDDAAGFAIGTVSNLQQERGSCPFGLTDLWADILGPLGKPIMAGIPVGHVADPWTLPLGCLAEMDASSGSLVVLEAAVS